MTNDLKRVGLVFTQEGAVDFKKTLQEVNLELNKNYNQFKQVQAQWDNSTKSTEKLRAEQEYLKNAYAIQTDKINTLKMQLSDLENAENKNTTAIKKKRNELTTAETKLETYNRKIKEIENQLNNTGKRIIEFGSKIGEIGKKIESAGKKVSAFSIATTTALVACAKNAIDFEDAFTGVEKTVDGTEEQMSKLKQGIRDMAKEIPSTTTEISAVAEAAGQLGIKTENILDFSKAMIDLGNSTNLTAEEAASQLAKFANIMQMSQGDFDKLGSTIVDLGNHFATTEADIVDMAMRLAGAGKQVGLSEAQVLGLATALSSVGIEAEMGGSAISKAMVKMQNAVEQGGIKLDTVLKKTGMTLRDLELMAANDSMGFKEMAQSIGMTSTEVKQLITAGTNLEDFARISGMTTQQFKKAWKEDAAGALSAFIKGLGEAENKGESAITMLSEMGLTEVRLRDSLLRAANAGSLFNDTIETGTKAWEDNTALTNEANKRYDTLKSQIQIAIQKIQDIAISIGEKLMPSIQKILDGFSEWIKKFESLSDEQVDMIVNIGLIISAIGPLITIFGKLTSTVRTVTKGIGTIVQAIGVMNGTVTTSSTAVNALASIMTSLSNPTTLAITAIGLLTTATMAYYIATEKEKVSLGGLRDEVNKQRESWNNLQEARNKNLSNSVYEIENCERLIKELAKITDENGKVKEGYKERAQVILNDLNNALGTEYKLNGNIIDSYQNLKDNIEKVISAKKAEAILNAYQEEYAEAIKKQAEATETLIGLKQKLTEASEKMASGTALERSEAKQQYESIAREIGEQTELIGEYGKTITEYENLQVASLEGNSEKIETATNNLTASYKRVKQETESSISEQINIQATYVEYLKDSLKEAEQTNNEYQKKILNTQLETNKQKLADLVDNLVQETNAIQNLTPEQIEAWKKLAQQSYSEYDEALSKVSEKTKHEIEKSTGIVATNATLPDASEFKASHTSMIFSENLTLADITQAELNKSTDIVSTNTSLPNESGKKASNTSATFKNNLNLSNIAQEATNSASAQIRNNSSVESATAELGQEANRGFNNNVAPSKWGADLVSLLAGGLTSGNSKSIISRAASKVGSWISSYLHFSVPDKGPLSDMDESMPDMIELMAKGIDDNKSKLIKSVKNMSSEVKDELETINGEDIETNKDIPLNKYNTNNEKYIFNMNVYCQKLDNKELDNIFNYINKRFGTEY